MKVKQEECNTDVRERSKDKRDCRNIGDLDSTTEQYYIAVRKKLVTDGKVQQVVQLPTGARKQGA